MSDLSASSKAQQAAVVSKNKNGNGPPYVDTPLYKPTEDSLVYGTIKIAKKHSILIYCNNQGRDSSNLIVTPLPKTFKLIHLSRYGDFFSQAVGGTLNTVLNAIGMSMTFKWTKTPIWESTDPIRLEIPIYLVAQENAEEEIYQVLLKLMNLVSPDLIPGTNFLQPPGPDVLKVCAESLGKFGQYVKTELETNPTLKAEIEGNDLIGGVLRFLFDKNILEEIKNIRNRIFQTKQDGKLITIEIGNFFKLDNMILTDVNVALGGGAASILPINFQGFPILATVMLSLEGTRIMSQNVMIDNLSDLYSVDAQLKYVNSQRGLNSVVGDISSSQDAYNWLINKRVEGQNVISSIYKKILKL